MGREVALCGVGDGEGERVRVDANGMLSLQSAALGTERLFSCSDADDEMGEERTLRGAKGTERSVLGA